VGAAKQALHLPDIFQIDCVEHFTHIRSPHLVIQNSICIGGTMALPSTRNSKKWIPLAIAAVTSLVVTACGGSADSSSSAASSQGASPVSLTAVIAAPSGIAFYPPIVAQAKGYFDGAIELTVEPADGSGAGMQQLLSGQADICICSPGPALKAVEEGADLVSVYTLYQSDVFALQTTLDSGITTAEDLRGKVVGVDSLGAGAESWLVPLMSAQGLEAGVDYEILATGPGAAPLTAFERGEIQAYAAAFIDTAVLRLRGAELKQVELPGSEIFFDAIYVMKKDFVDANPGVIKALGRGSAMATVFGGSNPKAVLDIIGAQYPDEVTDMPFAEALLAETQSLYALPPSADGQWGFSVPQRHDALIAAFVSQGYLTKPVNSDFFNNEFVTDYNQFDSESLS
jgi:NitT/TauT family transport system substrate-binding protein